MGFSSKLTLSKEIAFGKGASLEKGKVNKRREWTNFKGKRRIIGNAPEKVARKWRNEEKHGTTKINRKGRNGKENSIGRGWKIEERNWKGEEKPSGSINSAKIEDKVKIFLWEKAIKNTSKMHLT